MKTLVQEEILRLQSHPKCIRNICILAHVDHGKTTLADALVASNGIISKRLAGKLRYLDSLPEEQLRGITMKSSAISLLFRNDPESYLINLIDSPGHIDFSSEVSTAVRLCDGALVVVDVVEGVCPQTHAVLRQAWLEGIKPCLVLNKIDRLITELQQSPLEAFMHLQKILEQVNAVTGTLFSSDVFEKTSQNQIETKEFDNDHVFDWSSGLEEVDDSLLYFSPEQGNVLFASAIDGWGFRTSDFAEQYSKKMGICSDVLCKTLWGDYYLNNKTKRVMQGAQAKAKKPLFVQFILNCIWEVYQVVYTRRDKERIEKIVQSLNLNISARDSRQSDTRAHLQAIFQQWLPLSEAVLRMVVEKLPSPANMSCERVEKLMCSGLKTFESLPAKTKNLKEEFLRCCSEDGAPVIIFVSKMFVVDEQVLPQNKRRPLTQEEIAQRRDQARLKHSALLSGRTEEEPSTKVPEEPDQSSTMNKKREEFIAFARVYSGLVKKGQKLYVLGPKYDPACEQGSQVEHGDVIEQPSQSKDVLGMESSVAREKGGKYVTCFTVKDLYLLMGRELEALDVVPAGNVLGIGGLEDHVLKSATISSTLACPPFTALPFDVRPLVRVAVEPVHPGNMSALRHGMCLLNQADPIVEVLVQETGEYVLVGTGEVHIQRCVDDLRKRYANVELKVSDPIIPFRETIVPPPKIDMVNEVIQNDTTGKPASKDREKTQEMFGSSTSSNGQVDCSNIVDPKTGLYRAQTGNKRCSVLIRACPLPCSVTQLLDSSAHVLKDLKSFRKSAAMSGSNVNSMIKGSALEKLKDFHQKLKTAFEESGKTWQGVVDKIWAFGPRHVGANVLLNNVPGYKRPSIWKGIVEDDGVNESCYHDYDNSITHGFLLATSAGPLCEEPLMGVCFIIENIIIIDCNRPELGTNLAGTNGDLENKERISCDPGSEVHHQNERDGISEKKNEGMRNHEKLSRNLGTVVSQNEGVGISDEEGLSGNSGTELSQNERVSEKNEGTRNEEVTQNDEGTRNEEVIYSNSVSKVSQNELRAGVLEKDAMRNEEGISGTLGIEVSQNKGVSERNHGTRNEEGISVNLGIDVSQNDLRMGVLEKSDKTRNEEGLSKNVGTGGSQNEIFSEETQDKENQKLSSTMRNNELFGVLSGQVISTVKDGCRQAFLCQPARLMAAMYSCTIQIPADVLGKMYGVISKREGRVLREDMKEGSDIFIVNAVLPVAESFGFTEEIRKKTSGLARPLLQFTHWEVIDIDPYWVPTTEEEYLHFGEKADSENQARKYMNSVRRRKGLYVEAKTVEHAEKTKDIKEIKEQYWAAISIMQWFVVVKKMKIYLMQELLQIILIKVL